MQSLDTPPKKRGLRAYLTCLTWAGGIMIFFCGVTFLGQATMNDSNKSSSKSTPVYRARFTSLAYDELARNTEYYIGDYVTMAGRVIQVIEHGGNSYTMLVSISRVGQYTDGTLMLDCRCNTRPLEDDNIGFTALVEGRQTYETLLGAPVTVPRLTIETYTLN